MINQNETNNNVTIEVNVNAKNNSIGNAPDLGNSVINSEKDDNNEDENNVGSPNSHIPIAAPSAILLPSNFDLKFPDVASEKEDNKVQVVNPSGSTRKYLWSLHSETKSA